MISGRLSRLTHCVLSDCSVIRENYSDELYYKPWYVIHIWAGYKHLRIQMRASKGKCLHSTFFLFMIRFINYLVSTKKNFWSADLPWPDHVSTYNGTSKLSISVWTSSYRYAFKWDMIANIVLMLSITVGRRGQLPNLLSCTGRYIC